MAQPLSTEERLAVLEKEVVELKRQLAERLSFEGLRTDVKELQVRYQAHEEYVTDRLNDFKHDLTVQIETVESNLKADIGSIRADIGSIKEGQQALQSGQNQILAILTGKAKTND